MRSNCLLAITSFPSTGNNWPLKEAKTEGNPQGNVLTMDYGQKNHAMTFENFALDPKWNWKLKQLYDAAGVEWGSSVEGLMQQQVAATVTINDTMEQRQEL